MLYFLGCQILIPFSDFFRALLLQLALVELSFGSAVYVHQLDRVFYQVLLERKVERTVSGETGALIHFQQPRFQVHVDQNVESQNLETDVVRMVPREN